jgi:hypothetical protein
MLIFVLFTLVVSTALENHTPMFAERGTFISPLSGTVKTTVKGSEKHMVFVLGEYGELDIGEGNSNETVSGPLRERLNVVYDGFGRVETEAVILSIPHVPKKLGLVFLKNA